MRPFFFGDATAPLLGVHHPPQSTRSRDMGIVLCYPMGREAVGAFRSYLVLANRLARLGFNVLRFDYFGTGDSAGEDDAGSLDRWTADVGAALDLLKTQFGLRRVGVVGMRLGATLAALASRERNDVRFVALWEPVVRGTSYVTEMRAYHQAWLDQRRTVVPNAIKLSTPDEILGYVLTHEMVRELEQLDGSSLAALSAEHVLLMAGDTAAATELGERLRETTRVHQHLLTGQQAWSTTISFDLGIVATEGIDAVTNWVAELEK